MNLLIRAAIETIDMLELWRNGNRTEVVGHLAKRPLHCAMLVVQLSEDERDVFFSLLELAIEIQESL